MVESWGGGRGDGMHSGWGRGGWGFEEGVWLKGGLHVASTRWMMVVVRKILFEESGLGLGFGV